MHKILEQKAQEHFGSMKNLPVGVDALFEAISVTLTEAEQCFNENQYYDKLPFGILVIDLDNRVLCANTMVHAIFGLPSGDCRNTPLFDEIAKKLEGIIDIRNHVEQFVALSKEKDINEFDFHNQYLRIITARIHFSKQGSTVQGTVLVFDDITKSKLSERNRDEFFSIASHELRTPLTAIRGNASMLIDYYGDKLPDNDARQMVDDILESSKRLIQIVNDFLDVSRLELNRMQFRNEFVDITPIISSTLTEVAELAKQKNISISFHNALLPATLIYADPARVKQVIMNLMSNAIHYTEHGGITVEASVDAGSINILFKDTGVGIAEERTGLLFQKFQQAGDKNNARESMSTGLGLYISKKIVDHMKGEIQLQESELGVGSVFRLTLPVAYNHDG